MRCYITFITWCKEKQQIDTTLISSTLTKFHKEERNNGNDTKMITPYLQLCMFLFIKISCLSRLAHDVETTSHGRCNVKTLKRRSSDVVCRLGCDDDGIDVLYCIYRCCDSDTHVSVINQFYRKHLGQVKC